MALELLDDDEKVETMGLEEDEQVNILNNITDPEELKAAKELIEEEIENAEKDESDKSDKSSEAPKTEDKPKEFLVTDEFIKSQPEENRAILTNFLGKSKEELAKAAANAIAVKSPYIKDNEQAINAIAEKIKGSTDEELVKTFIETQREVGRTEKSVQEEIKKEPPKIELPELEDTPEVKKAISNEVVKRLKSKYPAMPEDMDSVEHKEWLRELQDEDLRGAIEFTNEIKETQTKITEDFRKVAYLKNNWVPINNGRLENEVKQIENNLKKLGLSPKDLGVDLTLKKNGKTGLLENEILNDLAYNGEYSDPYVIGHVGDLAFYRDEKDKSGNTPLAKKFIYEHNFEILRLLNSKESETTKKEIERVKETNLNTLQDKTTSNVKTDLFDPKKISEMTDEQALQKLKLQLENSE
jgi:hypothetical protein